MQFGQLKREFITLLGHSKLAVFFDLKGLGHEM